LPISEAVHTFSSNCSAGRTWIGVSHFDLQRLEWLLILANLYICLLDGVDDIISLTASMIE
jgi:hypothetical protein